MKKKKCHQTTLQDRLRKHWWWRC